MNWFVWFLLGAFIGFDVALGYAWFNVRRDGRSVVRRVGAYTGAGNTNSDPGLFFDHTKKKVTRLDRRRPW